MAPVNLRSAQTLFHELVPTNQSAEFEARADKGLIYKNFVIIFTYGSQFGKNKELLVFDIDRLVLSKITPSGTPKLLDSSSSFTLCLFNQDKIITYGGFEEKVTGGGLFGSRPKKIGCLGSFEVSVSSKLR